MILNLLFDFYRWQVEDEGVEVVHGVDECLKHSSYTRVDSPFSRLSYRNFIVFVVRSLIFVSGVVAGTVE